MAAHKYPEACAAFEKSQQLEPAVTTLLNLAGCREKNGQLATAWGLFLEAERQTRSATDASGTKLHDVAKQRAQALEATVSKLTIKVPQKSAIEGLEIKRGSERVDSVMWNRALPIDGGTYSITARAPGATVWSTRVTVDTSRDSKTVDIPILRKLEPDATAQPAKKESEDDDTEQDDVEPVDTQPSHSRALPLAVGAGAVALLGAAVGFELWARSTYDDAKAETTDQGRRDSLEDSANTKRYGAEGFAVAGVACAGVAVWLLLRPSPRGTDETASENHVVVSPTGLAFAGRF
jgi:hypothetical protein